MKSTDGITRRRFLQAGLAGSAALAAGALPGASFAEAAEAARDPFHGLKVGIASYSLRKFNLDQAIAMTKEAGVKYITLKDVHLAMKSTPAERKEARRKIEDAGLVLMGGGVISIANKEEAVRGVFEYAKDAGMPTIVCSPDPAALDTVEKMAGQYGIRIAIHNHGPGDKRYPSPLDVLKMVKDRDPRMGLCMDVGHTVRLGEDAVAVLKQVAPRLNDFHMKDVTEAKAGGKPVAVGKGVIDIPGVLKVLVAAKFPYHVALEHEADADAPMPGIIESFAYMRQVLAKIAMEVQVEWLCSWHGQWYLTQKEKLGALKFSLVIELQPKTTVGS
jgi:sugar phosphate isomerase/epimerase